MTGRVCLNPMDCIGLHQELVERQAVGAPLGVSTTA
jgi:hypothetical protein